MTNIWRCPINRRCSKKFGTESELIEHCAIDHSRFHCTHCPKVRMFADLHKHLRDVHGIIENAIWYVPSHTIFVAALKPEALCPFLYLYVTFFYICVQFHLHIHTHPTNNINRKRYISEHCGKMFGCNRTLQYHIRRQHTISEKVQCDICKEFFKSRETIRSHMNYVHVQAPQVNIRL